MTLVPFIFGLTLTIVSLYLTFYISRIYLLTKIKATIFLLILLSAVSVNGTLFAFVTLLSDQFEFVALCLYVSILITALISVFCIIWFFEYLEFGRTRAGIFFIAGILIGAFFAGLYFPDQFFLTYSETFSSWLLFVSNYQRIVVGALGLFTLYKIFSGYFALIRAEISDRLKFQFKLIVSGFVIGLLGLTISVISGLFISEIDYLLGNILRGSYPLILSIGLLITVIGVRMNPYSIYVISQTVYQIIVFNEKGVMIFDYNFRSHPTKQATLITGAIYGVSSMIQHALGIESHPLNLQYLNRVILFEFREKIGFALISDKDSRILRNGLRNFADQFYKAYEPVLLDWKGSIKKLTNATEFFKTSFPFLDLHEFERIE
ncbi:MAG: hypothetical protein EU536_03500 [Promethearchaeota archaeon]|nr:MAG: hypothetical protein EU536_03500 [Candidatus Lokiarchaeota archaeon]